ITLGGITARDNNGSALPTSGSSGTVNGCASGPTCDDGMMNGNETGVDCGGPDCDACPTAPLSLDVQDGSANIGETVCVDVTVGDFTNVTDLALTLNFDPTVLQLSSVTANTALPGFGSGNFNTGTAGEVEVTYTSGTPRSLADDAPLFTVCWIVLTGDETDVTISDASATNGAGTDLTVSTSDGTINIGGVGANDALTFRVSSGTAGLNQEICLEVTTENFTNIAGFQFAIVYDQTHLQFNPATSGSTNAVAGLQLSNLEPGVIRALWADPGAVGNNLDDGTNLINLCFTVLIPCETDVDIIDVAGTPIRATDGNNQTVTDINTSGGTVNGGLTTNCDVTPPDNLVLDLGTASGGVGQEVCIDLTVDNFDALTDLRFSITYDASIVSFSRATNFGLSSITAANVETPSDGVITFDWDATNPNGQTLADGSVMLSLCFTIDALQPTNVNFANSPMIIQAMNGSGQNVGVIPSGGNINPDIPVTDGMTLDIGELTGNVGDIVCLPISVFDPEPLTALQFTIAYDPTILEYIPGDNQFAFNGFLSINSQNPVGNLRVLWDDTGAMENNIGNGGVLFQICFRILTDDPAAVTFMDGPTFIEFSNLSGVLDVDLLPGQINGGQAPMIVGADVENPSCFGEDDGSISLNVTGGNNLTYDWSPNIGSGPTVMNLPAG
ncbi:MAG: cohesin domain-containing protein, partial [Bacteroidota bacterium]